MDAFIINKQNPINGIQVFSRNREINHYDKYNYNH